MRYKISGDNLICTHCGGADFETTRAKMKASMMNLFDLGWLEKTSTIYICSSCGHVEWFAKPVIEKPELMTEPIDCLACGYEIPAGEDSCKNCGWTYNVLEV